MALFVLIDWFVDSVLIVLRFQDFKIYYITQAHMCNISKHNNMIQYVNIENMGDREGIYFRLNNCKNIFSD